MTASPPDRLDLRGTPCPLNYIRTRLALEKLPGGAELEVWLDRGEPERLVSEGLRHEGHAVTLAPLEAEVVRLTVLKAATGGGSDG
jgi:TusA-related sulfurtransferase